jgi:predicted extracellular nuclease
MDSRRKLKFVLAICAFLPFSCISQHNESLRFMFYNVENFFDTRDDSLSLDEEFTPGGDKHWTNKRYYKKLDQLASAITAVGEWELPAIIGLCEIENMLVLSDLCAHRLLIEGNYHILHKDSPDRRGIDVAMLYRPEYFDPVEARWIPIRFDADSNLYTRDILFVKGLVFLSDTMNIFINHWPSRWGGVAATSSKRIEVAATLRNYIDSLQAGSVPQNILIAGDFNDSPRDSSLLKVLNAQAVYDHNKSGMYNLMYPHYSSGKTGTIKYQASWEVFDQIIVSGTLLDHETLYIQDGEAHIFSAGFLLQEDERNLGEKPFRTYSGPKYIGGFSDHLPVYIDLVK